MLSAARSIFHPLVRPLVRLLSPSWIRFDRNELAGSFGDIGTDLPLILAMIPAAGLDLPSVFILFGAMQILTGVLYGLPMPMQPLKAMAVLVISQKLSGNVLAGGGLAIGLLMLALSLSGALGRLSRSIPLSVVRGIQFGLGLSLVSLALKTYVPAEGFGGYALAAGAFALTLLFWGNRRFPAALFVIGLGAVYALVGNPGILSSLGEAQLSLPALHTPGLDDIWTGFLVLALPQLPLSLSNSVFATERTLKDLYPERQVSVRKIGLTFSVLNIVVPFFRGVPVCHGCGGLAGHYAFGARTGGSVIIYGTLYVVIGLFFAGAAAELLQVFPKPVLGVVLFFEALILLRLIADVARARSDLTVALVVAAISFTLPQGFLIALLVGVGLSYLSRRFGVLEDSSSTGR